MTFDSYRDRIQAVVPPPSDEELEDLRASIARFGVLTPIIVDENNRTIDGFTRQDFVHDLKQEGVLTEDYVAPSHTVSGLTDEEKVRLGIALNILRRHLQVRHARSCREQLEPILKALPEWSDRRIAEVIGWSRETVRETRHELEAEGKVEVTTERIGRDGLTQPVDTSPQNENRGDNPGPPQDRVPVDPESGEILLDPDEIEPERAVDVPEPEQDEIEPEQAEEDAEERDLDRPIKEPVIIRPKVQKIIDDAKWVTKLLGNSTHMNERLTKADYLAIKQNSEELDRLLERVEAHFEGRDVWA